MLQFQFVFFEILSLPKRQRVPPYWGTPNSAFPHRSRRFELDKPPAALVDWCWSQRFETTVKTLGKALRINLGIRGSCLRFFASCKRAVRISRASSSGSCLARKFTRPAISEAQKCPTGIASGAIEDIQEIQGDSRRFQDIPGARSSHKPISPKTSFFNLQNGCETPWRSTQSKYCWRCDFQLFPRSVSLKHPMEQAW